MPKYSILDQIGLQSEPNNKKIFRVLKKEIKSIKFGQKMSEDKYG